jgi:hypothetical protein
MRRGHVLVYIIALCAFPAQGMAAIRYVTKGGVDNATCAQSAPCANIQHAVVVANAADTISIAKGTYKESFGVRISKDLTVNGAGPFSTTVSTVWNASVFTVDVGVTATITGIFVRHGHAENGGGIKNEGTLTLERVRIWQNESEGSGGGILNTTSAVLTMRDGEIAYNKAKSSGGGLSNQGVAVLHNVRVVANHAPFGGGIATATGATFTATQSLIAVNDSIAISSFGSDVTLTNTTVSGNRGGGITTQDEGRTRLTHVTVANNGIGSGDVAGLFVESGSELYLLNTIVANNNNVQCEIRGGPSTGTVVSGSGSLDSDNTCTLFPPPHNLIGVDPQLGPLKNNGGTSHTHALLTGSPAIDHATSEFCEAVDQRGVLRPVDGDLDGEPLCDIGAYERAPLSRER